MESTKEEKQGLDNSANTDKVGVKRTNRARKAKNFSKQEQFTKAVDERNDVLFSDYLSWVDLAGMQEPPYLPDSRVRDAWLSKFWHLEPHLAGVLNSVMSIDANRGWSLIGGRNQVLRYINVLHSWVAAPGLAGWRPGISVGALSYYTTDMCMVLELGRDGANGPVREIYHTDPTKCKLTGNRDTPLRYYGSGGKSQLWGNNDFLRVPSMVSIEERFNGLGYCAVSRCLQLAQIMIAVYQHDMEELGARAPRGLLLLKGISEAAWKNAMAMRTTKLDGEGWKYFDAVAVLASNQPNAEAILIALSQLPKGFDINQFTSLLMYGYSLVFGYDPSEFWPVQYGSLGRGRETEVQHEKATGKGGKSFVLTLQEQLQRPGILPDTLQFEFDERDDQGEIAAASVQKAWTDVYSAVRNTGLKETGTGGISNEEYRILLAEKNVLPREWANAEQGLQANDENVEGGDVNVPDVSPTPSVSVPGAGTPVAAPTGAPKPAIVSQSLPSGKQLITVRDYLMSLPSVQRALAYMPDIVDPHEPVMRYNWKPGQSAIHMLYPSWDNLARRVTYAVGRATPPDNSKVLYKDKTQNFTITEKDVDKAVEDGTKRVGKLFGSMLDNTPKD